MAQIPKKHNHVECENKWVTQWDQSKLYAWDSTVSREDTFVVDTPPPTVSGSLHVGHVFSYTQTDVIVRYQRMLGKNIMYPMGWDDNGLPTERRVQNKFRIRCNPHLPYDADWTPERSTGTDKQFQEISRRNFIEACALVTEEDEAAFEDLWRRLGLSLDWDQTYATIDDNCRTVSQFSFLDLVDKGLVQSAESPTMWDVDYQTALAQADLEDRNCKGAYHDIAFAVEGGGEFIISTTRPELLVSCIAVAAHPDDERYKDYFGKYAITPLFKARVPIVAADHADPEKGTGILMICTFGDIFDVQWWKQSDLPLKQVIGRNGRLIPVEFGTEPFESTAPEEARAAYAQLEGKNAKQARKAVVELLQESGSDVSGKGTALRGKIKEIEHPVKFYEKGDRPVEFVTTRQWFVKILDHKKELVEQGAKISWHPEYMQTRYEHWVEGLSHDWCISRQRFFGVSFPVWYPLDAEGEVDYQNPIYADRKSLPIDPLSDCAPGYTEEQRGKPGGFVGDPDVMDTWATSSLTPQIVSKWGEDKDRHQKLFPMDIRPQAHDIIRTWAFYTIAKAWMHDGEVPWHHAVISGWILDPDRKKMSKSKGNVVTPQHLLDQYSSDAVRYWASRARLGVDTAFDDKVFKSGQKLATKLFNASRFVLMQLSSYEEQIGSVPDVDAISEVLDKAYAARLLATIEQATDAFGKFDYASALQATESAFWHFCDHYVEIVKGRTYEGDDSAERKSGVATLRWSLSVFLRLFAPVMPFVTEEIWSWHFAADENDSVHTAAWPNAGEVSVAKAREEDALLDTVVEVVEGIRQTKSEQQKTLKWPVESLEVIGTESDLDALRCVLDDIKRVGRVKEDGVLLTIGDVADGKRVDVRVHLSDELGA